MNVNAELIKELRHQHGWTQQLLADACDVSLRTVQRVERYGNASKETLMSLSAVLERPQSELILPEEPVEVVEQVVAIDGKHNKKLLVYAVLFGMVLGANLMFFINLFMDK